MACMKIPRTHKYNHRKVKSGPSLRLEERLPHTRPGLGFEETKSLLTGKLRRAPPPRGPAPHLASGTLRLRRCVRRALIGRYPALSRCHWLPGPLCSRSQPLPNRAAEVRGHRVSSCGSGRGAGVPAAEIRDAGLSPSDAQHGPGNQNEEGEWSERRAWSPHLSAGAGQGSRIRPCGCGWRLTRRTPFPWVTVAAGLDPATCCRCA